MCGVGASFTIWAGMVMVTVVVHEKLLAMMMVVTVVAD